MQPPQRRQHPDMQMLQRQIMFKQLQEMQQKQQLDEYGNPRQQNYINQLSLLSKQAYGGQLPPLSKSTPVGDASQFAMAGNMHLMQHGASPVIQGFSQGLVFSQAQNNAMSSVGAAPPQIDVSLYGTPITAGNNLNQYSHIQAASPNFGNMLTRENQSQVELPMMQSSNFSNSFISEQSNRSSEQNCMPNGAFVQKHVFQVKNSFGQVPVQGSLGEVLPGNFQQLNTMQRNGAVLESRRQDVAGWPGHAPMLMPESRPPRGTTTLDPLEEKILFNTDDDCWEASLGGQNQLSADFDSTGVHADNSSLFPSIQSGSWSALMQSAVAEASSSDTGAQEEWSGLSFQNPELSTENQPSTYMDTVKQETSWVDNNLQNVGSPNSKPQLQFHNLHMHGSFTGFQQSNYPSLKQRDGVCSDSSHGSAQQSPKNANKWSDCSPHQKHAIDESHQVQLSSPLQNIWPMQHQENSENNMEQRSTSSYTIVSQAGCELRGNVGLPGPVPWPGVLGSNESPIQGFLLDNQRNSKASEDVQLRRNNSVLIQTSAGLDSPTATDHSREKMVHLLRKDEESVENGSGMRSGSRDSITLCDLPHPNTSDASVADSRNNFSISQGFSFFLGPQNQKMSKSYLSRPVVENSSMTFPSGPPSLNSQLPNQHLYSAPLLDKSPQGRGPEMASGNPASGSTSKDGSNTIGMTPCGQEFPILETVPAIEPSAVKGVSWKAMAPNSWSAVRKQPSTSHSEPHSAPGNSLPSPDSATSSLQNPAGASQYHRLQSLISEGNEFHKIGACSGKSQGIECREELMRKDNNTSALSNEASQNRVLAPRQDIAKHIFDANAATSSSDMTSMHRQAFGKVQQTDNRNQAVSPGDLEAFGRSLRPSYGLHQKSLPLHQAHSLQNVENDPRNRLSEIDNGHKLAMRNLSNSNHTVLSQLNSSSSGDNRFLGSMETEGDQSAKASSQLFFQRTRDMMFGQTDTETRSAHSGVASNAKGQAQITAQMATSWFKHYGTLKDGQMLSMYDTQAAKNAMHHLAAGKSFQNLPLSSSIIQVNSADASQGSSIWPTLATASVAGQQLPPLHELSQNLAALRSKKRKVAALNLLPWHKEVTQGPTRLLNISMAEAKWALAANRLKEKLEYEGEVIDDVIPIPGAKRRLTLTTQLIQQVFLPAPVAILSDSSSNCVNVAYFAARSALGDACGLTIDSGIPSDSNNMPSEKLGSPERPRRQDFSKTLEDFISRAKRLESDLSRMERGISFIDLGVESLELEKFSMINRLAKFHSRGHTAATDTMSSAGSAPIPKPFAQRYVIALPMPKTLPEGANCLSL